MAAATVLFKLQRASSSWFPAPCSLPYLQTRLCHQSSGIKKVMFLGMLEFTPTSVLGGLLSAAKQPGANFEVCAMVAPAAHIDPVPPGADVTPKKLSTILKRRQTIQGFVDSSGLPEDRIMFSQTASEASFLAHVRELSPDLCVTAGFNFPLPPALLDIPPLGTIRVHASLLPQFRGAYPVERALEAGVSETGVSLHFAVQRCDAGPVLQQVKVDVDPAEGGPALTARLMALGGKMLVDNLPDLLAGRALARAVPQEADDARPTSETLPEGWWPLFKWVDLQHKTAQAAHNKVGALRDSKTGRSARAHFRVVPRSQLVNAPGASASFNMRSSRAVKLKLLSTRVVNASEVASMLAPDSVPGAVVFYEGRVLAPCLGGDYLELLQVEVLKDAGAVGLAAKDLARHLKLDGSSVLVAATSALPAPGTGPWQGAPAAA